MMIHICDRCHTRKEVQTGESVEAEGWLDGLCRGCSDAKSVLKQTLREFTHEALKAFHYRERQPELKKLW